ncbi:phage lysis regulatory protein LysB [Aeromonas schubertii]|uniref:Phage lysis regulatory protein LysB n=1 Tax=Aeromonas schubertii TaxID=652 RepID=A0ABS7V5T7_9GAMM|nr:phage lysis regulatory protein LysB [Aeromonas schubertii]MBZ6064703.1 phage lysis regulatory protein LysB [Aeromonas schubertii]
MWPNLLRSPITLLLLALAVTLGGWGWSASSAATARGDAATLQNSLKAEQDKAAEAVRRERAKEGAITALQNELAAQSSAAAALQGQLDELATLATTRADTIRRLTRENDELRTWAARPLPAAARRLLQRPALTGADAYQDHLSAAASLPIAGSQPGH